MLPKVIAPSELRKNLAQFLNLVGTQIIFIKGKNKNCVILDENEYNRISGLANQFAKEDPEGKYRPEFVSDMLERSQNIDVDEGITSLKSLI